MYGFSMALLLLLEAFCPIARAAFDVGYTDDLNIVRALAEDDGKKDSARGRGAVFRKGVMGIGSGVLEPGSVPGSVPHKIRPRPASSDGSTNRGQLQSRLELRGDAGVISLNQTGTRFRRESLHHPVHHFFAGGHLHRPGINFIETALDLLIPRRGDLGFARLLFIGVGTLIEGVRQLDPLVIGQRVREFPDFLEGVVHGKIVARSQVPD